jgi:transposase
MREETGDSYSAIATALGVSKSTVSRYLAKWRARIPVEGVGVVGRPKKVTENVRKQIRSLISANKHISSKGISAALAVGSSRRGSLEVAPRTVRRTLKEMNYKNSTPTRVPKLTDKHRCQRIDWCRKHLKFDWKRVIFSDETLIELDRCKLRQWHPRGKRPTNRPRSFRAK